MSKSLATGQTKFEPTSVYYQFRPVNGDFPKCRQLVKGMTFVGKFQITFTDKKATPNGVFTFSNHLVTTPNEGVISLPGCIILNNALENSSRGQLLKIVYSGKSKPKEGKKPTYLFAIEELTEAEYESETSLLISDEETEITQVVKPAKRVVKPAPVVAVEDTDDENTPF